MWSTVTIAVALCVLGTSAVFTHPDNIALRFRGGRMYREAFQAHHALMRDNDIYYNMTPNTLQQLLNASDPASPTFTQRYWVDYSAYDGNGTALLYINGEAPAQSSPTGYAAQYGHSKNAVLFTLENRYYGESMPSPLTNYDMLSKYLTVDFALEDLRNFMTYAEENIMKRKMRWLIVGGSYSGALSAWFKQKYPNAVLAAWSSSGVVNAQFNFYDYDGHVGKVIPPVCREAIQNVLQIFETMWDNNETTRAAVRAKFGVPDYFLKEDMSYMLADAAAGAVQYGNKWALCDAIVPQSTTDPLGQYNDMIVDIQGAGFSSGCYYSTMCLSNKSMSDDWAGAGYAWIFQTCSQMSYFQIGYYNSVRLAGVSTDYFVAQCRAAFSPDIFPDVYAFNAKYGGFTPNATNVIALQGADDPWSTTGVRLPLGVNYPAVLADCEDCGHCGDLMTPSASDPPSLQAQRLQIAHYLDIWLASEPVAYQLVINGDFLAIVSNNDSAVAIITAVQTDLHNKIDQSVTVTSVTSGSLIVNFTIEINSLNADIVLNNTESAVLNSSWLIATQTAFTALGGVGAITVASIGPAGTPLTAPPAPVEDTKAKCGTGCVVGVVIGCVAVVVMTVAVVNIVRRRQAVAQEPMNEHQNLVE